MTDNNIFVLVKTFHKKSLFYRGFQTKTINLAFSLFLKLEYNTLCQWQIGAVIDGIGLSSHILFP